MRVLVACEFSGTVRDAFAAKGHDAWSCDLLPSETPGNHYKGDVFDILHEQWDLMIAHPPCTHLAVSGARWFPEKRIEQQQAIGFFMLLATAKIPRIAIENPICIMSRVWRRPDQIIQPWQFGHGETKATCLWLMGLPLLIPTHADGDLYRPETPPERVARVHMMPPSPDRWRERSRTFPGIARAMADQWGGVAMEQRGLFR